MGYKTLPIYGPCYMPQAQVNELCLPPMVDCNPTSEDGFITECAKLWNCNLCSTDRPYYIPYYQGDKYILQVNFRDKYNVDVENPVFGWGTFVKAFLINATTNAVVSSNVADFASRYLVGWGGGKSIQLIEIDTSKPAFAGLTCWKIEFKSYLVGDLNIESYCTQEFIKEKCGLIGIESKHTTFDDFGQWYGEITGTVGVGGYFEYNNWTRIHGAITFTGAGIEKYIVGSNRAGGSNSEDHIFETNLLIAPFMFRYLIGVIFSAHEVTSEGKTYICPNQGVKRINKGSNMFLFSVSLQVITYQKTC